MQRNRIRNVLAVCLLIVIFVSLQSQSLMLGTTTVRTLVKGVPIHGTNGVNFGPDGLLYVASAIGQEIIVMHPRTGKILKRYGPTDGIVGPDDLTFGPDGSLYWTDILSGEVGRRTPDGVVTKQFIAPFVNPITFNAEGRLFVAQAFVDDGLYELDPELVDPPTLLLYSGNMLNHLNGFDFGPDGLLYAPRQQLNHIVRINVDTLEVELLTDQFHGACKFDSEGRLHVGTDSGVLRFDPDTGEVTLVAEAPSPGADNIAFDAHDRLYISNYRDGSIHTVLPNGNVRQLSPGGMMAPGGVAVLPDEYTGDSVFVADFWTVREFDGLTGQPGIVGADFFFDSPFTASADGENLILTSWFGNSVEVWDPRANQVLEMHLYSVPMNAIRFQDDLVVAELGSGSVVRQDVGGVRTPIATGLLVPSGLVATDDDLWVADWASGVVWQVVADGVLQDPLVQVAVGLTFPEGMAVDLDGSLLVVESGLGQLSRIDTATGAVTVVSDNLALGVQGPPGWPPTWLFNGVAVGEDGAIYVTGDVDNVIYRIEVRP